MPSAHVSGPDRPRADAAAVPDHGGAHQRHRHRGQPARGADGPLKATIQLKGPSRSRSSDTFSGPRYTGPMGAALLFSPLASIVNILVRNPMAPVRIESIDCDVQIEPGRKVASIESVRLASDTIEPGQDLKAFVTLKPLQGRARDVRGHAPDPERLSRGAVEAIVCDAANSIRRQFRNDPALLEPRDLEGGPIDPDPDRAQADRRVPARPLAGTGPVGQGTGAAELAGQRPGGLRVEAGDADAADPQRHDQRVAGGLGRRRHADAAVHRGQGCRAVVIVVSLSSTGPAPLDDNEERNAPPRSVDRVRFGLSHGSHRVAVDGARPRSALGLGGATPRSRPGGRKGRRLCQVASRRRGHLRQRPGPARACARAAGIARRRAGSGTWRGRARASCWRPPATRARSFGREPKADATWNVVYDSSDSQVLSLVVSAGRDLVFAGHRARRPGRQPDRPQASRLAARPEGPVHLGPRLRRAGQPLRGHRAQRPALETVDRTANGRCSTTARSTHLLCVAVGPDGSVYAGSDGEGLIYRVSPRRQGDDPLRRPPVGDPDAALGRRRRPLRRHRRRSRRREHAARSSLFLAQGGTPQLLDGPPTDRAGRRHRGRATMKCQVAARPGLRPVRPEQPGQPGAPRPPGGGSASPRPSRRATTPSTGSTPTACPAKCSRVKALVHALAWVDDRLLVGTGPEGQLFEVRDRGHETAPIAKLDSRADPLAAGRARRHAAPRYRRSRARSSGSPRDMPPSGPARLRGPRHQARQPLRRSELAGRAAPRHRRSRSRPAPETSASPTKPGRPGRPSRPIPARPRIALAAGPVRPVPRQALDDRPAADTRAALGLPQLPDGQPGPRDHPARRPRL